jgi:hypothetical protein
VRAAVLALGGSDCEALHPGLLGQPANAVSSVAYVLAGLAVWRRGGPAGPALALGAVGVGSVLYHGPMPAGAEAAHDGALVALAAAVALAVGRRWRAERRPRLPRPPALAVAALVAGLTANAASRTGAALCRPAALLQGHAAWHVLTALAAGMWLASWDRPAVPAVASPRSTGTL